MVFETIFICAERASNAHASGFSVTLVNGAYSLSESRSHQVFLKEPVFEGLPA